MRFQLIVLVVAIAVALQVAQAAPRDRSETTPAPKTYFGVDANDAEAVKEVQDEMNKEKFEQLFGDTDIEEMDFTPGDDHAAFKKLGWFLANMLDIFRTGTTTPSPVNQQ